MREVITADILQEVVNRTGWAESEFVTVGREFFVDGSPAGVTVWAGKKAIRICKAATRRTQAWLDTRRTARRPRPVTYSIRAYEGDSIRLTINYKSPVSDDPETVFYGRETAA